MQLLGVCKAPERPWDASKSGNFFYACLLTTLLLCCLPLSFFFARTHTSTDCGPHRLYPTGAQAVFGAYVAYAPGALSQALYWIFNPIVLVAVIFLLAIVIFFLRGSVAQYVARLRDSEKELHFEQKSKGTLMKKVREYKDRKEYVVFRVPFGLCTV